MDGRKAAAATYGASEREASARSGAVATIWRGMETVYFGYIG